MNMHPKRSRPFSRRSRHAVRPEILGLEERTMLASGLAAASAEAARSTSQVATSIILGEVGTLVAGQPLRASLLAKLNLEVSHGSMNRQAALERILRTPKAETSLVQNLSGDLLDREPTQAESRTLVAAMQTRGADVPRAFLQLMTKQEYFNNQGATNTGFVESTTMDLLHRSASSHELSKALSSLNRGGAAARAGFLNTLIDSRAFRLVLTQDAYQQFTGTSGTPEQQASALKVFHGPLGYTKMLSQVLASGASSTGIIPTLAENSGLSVKRVPGFLAGWTVPNLASPYDVANISGRSIDNTTVDYWAITLNALDSVLLTIVPTPSLTSAGFAVRIWGPDGKEIGTAITGTQFTFVAKTAGTYIMGISTADNTNYSFLPASKQTAPATPLVTYTAEFQTYPGSNTNTVDILQKYSNPAYTDLNWPTWSSGQASAYATLKAVATAGSLEPDPGVLQNFTDFEQVGDITNPQTFINWLNAAWAPFSAVLNDYNNADIAKITYSQTYGAYSKIAWQGIVQGIAQSQDIRDAYTSVHQLLETANAERANISTNFLKNLESYSTATTTFIGKDAATIATLMSDGEKAVPPGPTPVSPYAWLENLLAGIVSAGADAAGALADGFAPGSGSFAGLAVSAAGDQLVDLIDSWLDGTGAKPPPAKPEPTKDVTTAANEMDALTNNTYLNSFLLLTNQDFLTKIFSNYGLLQAMGTSQFTYSAGDQITSATVLKQDYDRSIWEQLLPQMYEWREVAPTDKGPDDTLPNFTFFIPATEQARWESPDEAPPVGDTDDDGYYNWPGPQNDRIDYSLAKTPDASLAEAIADARTEITALQSGASFNFPGYDFTLSNTGDKTKDYFGPGPVNGPQTITGNAAHFYTISTDSHLSQKLYRHTGLGDFGPDGLYQKWHTMADLTGVTIHQWALETPDGSNGWKELPAAAADALFGTGAVLNSPDPVKYTGGGSYFNFAVPTGALASRFEVFTQWGKNTPRYAPGTLQTPAVIKGDNMKVGTNPHNGYTRFIDTSYAITYTLTYGATSLKTTRKPTKTPAVLSRALHPAKRA
jgi:hypothetical protein